MAINLNPTQTNYTNNTGIPFPQGFPFVNIDPNAFVGIQSMSGPTSQIFYMDFVFEDDKKFRGFAQGFSWSLSFLMLLIPILTYFIH